MSPQKSAEAVVVGGFSRRRAELVLTVLVQRIREVKQTQT